MGIHRFVAVASVFCALSLTARGGRAQGCQASTVGLDSTFIEGAESSIALDYGLGQTFVARDTLIESIRIWSAPRGQYAGEGEGWHLLIAATDFFGKPNVHDIVLNDQNYVTIVLDSTRYLPVDFDFSPPFALPHTGIYELLFEPVPCGTTIIGAISGSNPYPDGDYFYHGRTEYCNFPSSTYTEIPSWDMIFQIQFCSPFVPTLPMTWGRLKAAYR